VVANETNVVGRIAMIVYLEPVAGSAKDNLERAKYEMERTIGFRGEVTSAKVEGNRIAVTVEINPKWNLPDREKDSTLRKWILVKTRKVFEVQFIK
jgi:hypothetical protein